MSHFLLYNILYLYLQTLIILPYLIHLPLMLLRVLLQLLIVVILRVLNFVGQVTHILLQILALPFQLLYLRCLNQGKITIDCFLSSDSITLLIPWLTLLSYSLLYDLIWFRY